ncbi:MAG TPA: Lrp/AsnC family transcriptional regulator [Halanaerobiales bacterium]|nr:Lrp/AsnC family transcriptional regulator [Halanaerobiales bacterium]
MDEVDKQILRVLEDNGRMSYAELGRRLDLTRVSIRERIVKLQKKGIIEKFTVVINPEKVDKKLSAFFEIDVEPNHLDEVANELAKEERVYSLYLMTGASTLHMHSLLKNQDELEDFLINKIYSQKGITRVKSNIILKRYKSREGGARL